jgi:O-methyltransferase/methyltransferase family protein
MQLVNGYQVSQAIHVAAALGIADLLADGARSSDDLAQQAGVDADTLYRLLRALASVGVLHEDDGRLFSLTPVGERLRSDVPGSLHGWAVFVGQPTFWQAWSNLLYSVQTGENAFRHVHGQDVWSYRAERPDESAIFDAAMKSRTGASNAALVEAFDFSRFGTLVDVGGGNGALLASVLASQPALQGVLFDQAHVVAGAGPVLEAAGVADRCRIESGSFFETVPEGGDAYLLKWIIHDWEDEESIAILRVVRAAMSTEARLLIVERDLGAPNADAPSKFSDLNMLVAPGGRERTEDEYAALFESAGFRLVGATRTSSELVVFEGEPV